MDHDWTDWTDHDGGLGDGGFGEGDLSSQDTADLGGDPHLSHDPPPDPSDGDGPSWLDDPDDGTGDPPAHEGFGQVDAHVDEPLHGAAAEPGGDTEPSWDAPGDEPAADPGPDPLARVLADPVFGSDPDAAGTLDADGWASPEFPPALTLGELPEPVDGPPWSDATLLGTEALADGHLGDHATGAPDLADLFGYAALDLPPDGDPWAALFSAEDPATSALARWWAPGG